MRIDESAICIKPFTTIEINPQGEVYPCCTFHVDGYSLGNINELSFDDIWFSKRAVDLRKRILNKDYSLCKEEKCMDFCVAHGSAATEVDALKFLEDERASYPVFVKYLFDKECNVQCIYCRDRIIKNSPEEVRKIEKYIDKLSAVINGCKFIYSSGNGDPFTGGCAEKFLKKIAEKSSKVKFELHTNGILCTKKKLEYLNIDKRIHTVIISLPGATKETYNKIVKYGNYDKVIENIEYLNSLRSSEENFDINLNFVLCSLNYHEILLVAEIAKRYSANLHCWEVRPMCSDGVDSEIEKISIANFSKEQLGELKFLLNNEIISQPHVILSPFLEQLRISAKN